MKVLLQKVALVTVITVMGASCAGNRQVAEGPIVLGDSSTIVTEQDERKLKDMVAELEPAIPKADTPATQQPADPPKPAEATPTVAATPAAQPARPVGNAGIQANFKEASFGIEAVNGKMAGNRNIDRAGGAVFTWESGDLVAATIKVSPTVTKVSQRYQTAVLLKSKHGDILIDALSTTSPWQTLKGNGGSYKVTGLDSRSLEYTDAGPAEIRNAVTRAARRRRLSRHATEELLRTIKHVRDANQKPMVVELRSVMWKLDGKDGQGRNFSKQVRVDIPL